MPVAQCAEEQWVSGFGLSAAAVSTIEVEIRMLFEAAVGAAGD
jgi:hypothetical protein